MAKVTSKLQVTVPKALAEQFGIAPGDDIRWEAAGDAIRIVPSPREDPRDRTVRRKLFDQATERQRERERAGGSLAPAGERGWTREVLYERRSSR
jgi:AbrB family looped-hinge helix DNA binding protein